jgi:diguanylate cyclase (GGDEF)-like protein
MRSWASRRVPGSEYLWIGGVFVVAVAIAYLVMQSFTTRSFERLERASVSSQAGRIATSLSYQTALIGSFVRTNAEWNAPYAAVANRDARVAEQLWPPKLTHRLFGLDAIVLVDRGGAVVVGGVISGPKAVFGHVPASLAGALAEVTLRGKLGCGVLGSGGVHNLYCAAGIVHTDGRGPVAGTLIALKSLDAAGVAAVGRRAGLVIRPASGHLSGPWLGLQSGLGVLAVQTRVVNSQTLDLLVRVPSAGADGPLVLRLAFARPIHLAALQSAAVSAVIFGVLVFVLLALSVLSLRYARRRRTRVFRDAIQAAADAGGHVEAPNSELAALAESVNALLDAKIRRETEQSRRDTFASHLAEALEMADDEQTTNEVVERAMLEIDRAAPMELLLVEPGGVRLRRGAASPSGGAPGCTVDSPFSCAAIRRGHAAVFESSDALNACPKLRGRESGSCSAVWVPIMFMGQPLGVLHTTAVHGEPPNHEQMAQLSNLAQQVGTRVGTRRAFERTTLQASTDSMTGLPNRRATETRLHELARAGGTFAVAIADLDHFKQLNDTHGHEAGDRAICLFAQVGSRTIRASDLIGRWGGEEFLFILPCLGEDAAVQVIRRLRRKLETACDSAQPRFTASFGITDSTAAEGAEALIRTADTTPYLAKQAGRNQAHTRSGLRHLEPGEAPDDQAAGFGVAYDRADRAASADSTPFASA